MSEPEDLLKVFAALWHAMMTNDPVVLREYYTPDIRMLILPVVVELRDLLFEKNRPGNAKLELFGFDEPEVDVFSDIAPVTKPGNIRGGFLKNYVFEHRIRFCDIFVRHSCRWLWFLYRMAELVPDADHGNKKNLNREG